MSSTFPSFNQDELYSSPRSRVPDVPANQYEEREELFAEFAPLVKRLIRDYSQHTELPQNLADEIYVRFCALLDAYDPKRTVPLRVYLVRQLSASVYDYVRREWILHHDEAEEAREKALPNETDYPPATPWITDLPHDPFLHVLPRAIAHLPEPQRKVVSWRYYEDRSFGEIAHLLDVDQATVRSLLQEGLCALRRQMGNCADTLE